MLQAWEIGRDLAVLVIVLCDAPSVLILMTSEVQVCNKIGNGPDVVVHWFSDVKLGRLRQEDQSNLQNIV